MLLIFVAVAYAHLREQSNAHLENEVLGSVSSGRQIMIEHNLSDSSMHNVNATKKEPDGNATTDGGTDVRDVRLSTEDQQKKTCDFSQDGVKAGDLSCTGLMYVPAHEFLFCGIEKCGITQLSHFSQALQGIPWHWYGNTPSVFNKSKIEVMADLQNQVWRKIVLLREPHSRFLSAYLSKCGGKGKEAEDNGRNCIHARPGVDFKTFVSDVRTKGFAGNPHFIRQRDFCLGLSQTLGTVWEPIILKRTTLNRDLKEKVCNHMGKASDKDLCLKKVNELYPTNSSVVKGGHNTNSQDRTREFYSAETWDMVSTLYADDIALFRQAGGPEVIWQSVAANDVEVEEYLIDSIDFFD